MKKAIDFMMDGEFLVLKHAIVAWGAMTLLSLDPMGAIFFAPVGGIISVVFFGLMQIFNDLLDFWHNGSNRETHRLTSPDSR